MKHSIPGSMCRLLLSPLTDIGQAFSDVRKTHRGEHMSPEWKDSGICSYFLSRFYIILEGCLLKTVTTFTLIFF